MSYKGMSLPKGFKKKWIAALRSGKYKQAKSKLLDVAYPVGHDRYGNAKLGKGYCCLGVACHIQGIQNRYLEDIPLIYGSLITKATKKGVPEELVGVAYDNDDDETYNPLVAKLAAMNDRDKSSFEKIADWIEKNL